MLIVSYCGMGNMGGKWDGVQGGAGTVPGLAGGNGGGHGFWRICYFVCSMPQTLSVRMTKKYYTNFNFL